MKIKVFILALFTAVSFNASARGLGLFDFGVKAGISTQRLHLYNANRSGQYNLSVDNKPALQLGAFVRLNFLTFHIQPELLYTFNRYELSAMDTGNRGNDIGRSKVKYNTFDVPVMFGMKFLMLRFSAGPVFTLTNNTSVVNKSGDPFSVEATRPTVSYALGLGLDLFRFNFDVRYNGRFSRGDQSISVGNRQGFDYKSKTQGWTFSLAYLF